MFVFNRHVELFNLFCLGDNLMNDFLNIQFREIFAKAKSPYHNSNSVTIIEGTLTTRISIVTISWPVKTKFLF